MSSGIFPFCKNAYKSMLAICLLLRINLMSLKEPFSVGPPETYKALNKEDKDEI